MFNIVIYDNFHITNSNNLCLDFISSFFYYCSHEQFPVCFDCTVSNNGLSRQWYFQSLSAKTQQSFTETQRQQPPPTKLVKKPHTYYLILQTHKPLCKN